ncbi:hypothetical protein CMUST_13890 [Corynebacterium mustelae]|uniref:Uncharacterized protein n=1 Tax=Corynebacterium mustelae TaxID=571915 RepID=A0A0G3H7C6_9CORY|nr:hypothetical protein [Corynebacterium mustelae]AKK07072.1 hypothetical protein CMUST_13890 [Corynebacterium mustelae]
MSPLRIAAVSANAAGLYVADLLMRCAMPITVDIFDQAPAPVGLRPNAAQANTKQTSRSSVRVIGNVTIGADGDLSIESLKPFYDAVIVADFASEAQAHGAVAAAVGIAKSKAKQALSDITHALDAHGVAFTEWRDALSLPTDRTLAQWQEVVRVARGVPVCV